MSDLQIALLLIGALIVMGVLIFNWNQERRYKRQAAAAFRQPTLDALLEKAATSAETLGRIEPGLREPTITDVRTPVYHDIPEPSLGIPPLPDTVPTPQPPPASTPTNPPSVLQADTHLTGARAGAVQADAPAPIAPSPAPPGAKPAREQAPIPPAPYDELIEFRVRIEGDGILAAVFAEDINRARSLGKTARWLGFPVTGTDWEQVQPWREAFYREVQVTLQLADRNGAVQEDELTGFCKLLQATAKAHGLKIVCDDLVEASQRAQSVDIFCVDVDVLIGLNVVARGEGAMQLAKVLKEVESAGLVLGVDGAYRLLDSRGEALYSLCNHDAEPFSHTALRQDTQAVTLQFDVPRVPDGLKVFDGMVSFGRKLANEVGGLLVDDNMRPLTESGIDKIRQQLASIYQRMEARGVPSGSRRALRLFS